MCYSAAMNKIPADIQARRSVEDAAIKLGKDRHEIERREVANIQAIVDLIPRAAAAHVSLDQLAKLIGVSRQTLYRWQDIAERLRAEQADKS
jgi:transcriptional regulator GlxA family with amidase domain